jgi:hypothetical protein
MTKYCGCVCLTHLDPQLNDHKRISIFGSCVWLERTAVRVGGLGRQPLWLLAGDAPTFQCWSVMAWGASDDRLSAGGFIGKCHTREEAVGRPGRKAKAPCKRDAAPTRADISTN